MRLLFTRLVDKVLVPAGAMACGVATVGATCMFIKGVGELVVYGK